MARYAAVRLVHLLPVLLLTSVAVWLLIYLIPGDPAIALLGPDVTPEQIARARARMGSTSRGRSSTCSGSGGSSKATSACPTSMACR
jgi:ABC-type dipeptide/oligopeptide/nickel transport system permease component